MKQKSTRVVWPYFVLIALGLAGGFGAYRILTTTSAKYTIGIVTWIGYAPIYVADERGIFKDEHLSLDVKIMDGTATRGPAYVNGNIDFYPDTPDSFVILFSTRKPTGKLVLALDDSLGADGIIAKKSIKSITDLRGKTVGFQSGITSHFLLLYLLDRYGLSGSDIQPQILDAGAAAEAFFTGHLDAAVTWEPWLTKAAQRPDSQVLATSADAPGLITDVLLVSDKVMQKDPEAVVKFKRAWYRAKKYMHDSPSEANSLIAQRLHVSAQEVESQLTKTHFYENDSESAAYLRGHLPDVVSKCAQLYFRNGVIKHIPSLNTLIDAGH
jgi:NitT/TauT family transport system substrate-binding protein